MGFLTGLGDAVTGPLAAALGDCGHVVAAPHGPLHDLPLQLLAHAGESPVDRWSLSYTPNLALYDGLVARDRGAVDLASARCLATAAAEDPERTHVRFAAITQPIVERSRHAAANGLLATRAELLAALQEADVVAVACHGRFDAGSPRASALLLSDGRRPPSRARLGQDGAVSLAEIMAVPIRTRLVVLAACFSGRQLIAPGDEPLGFASAFLAGGADAVLVANWSLDARAAAPFLDGLMEQWSTGRLSLGRATQLAYLATRLLYPHAFHWAAFSLFGDDGLRCVPPNPAMEVSPS
jgi:CHAT domain-containing protein